MLSSRVRGRQFGRQAVTPPRMGQLAELSDGNGRPRPASTEPSSNVFLRPEEIHRASGIDDVLPPCGRGHEAVKEQRLVVRPLVFDRNADRVAAIGT